MAPRLLALSQRRLAEASPGLAVEMLSFNGRLESVVEGGFDLVLAADAFRSYGAPRGSRHVEELTQQIACCMRPGGLLGIRFGPSWKSPYGGGLDSRLPWAHLLYPERFVFEEFRRARPDSSAATFEDIGVNRVTLSRCRRAMEATGLECISFETNMGGRRAIRPFMVVTRLPVLADYLTQNAYGVWRRPYEVKRTGSVD
jgi:DNA-binding transcriptional LysR family regulator